MANKEKHVTCVDIHISKLINMNSISIKINRTNKKCIQLIALLFPLFVEEQTLLKPFVSLPKQRRVTIALLPDETSVSP